MKRLILAPIVALTLSGCAALNFLGDNNLAIQYATMKYIEQNPGSGPRVCSLVDSLDVKLGESVTLGALKAYVESKLPDNLAPSDRLLASALIQAVVDGLEDEVGEGALDPADLVAVRRVLSQIEFAAGC